MSDTDPTPGTPVTLRDALSWWRGELRGSPPASIRDLAAALNELNTALTLLRGNGALNDLGAIGALLSTWRGEYLLETGYIKEIVLQIQQSIGLPTGDATTTALGYLAQIARTSLVSVGGLPPVVQSSDFVSVGNIVVGGRRYAKFNPPIAGVTIGENGYDVTANWAGWKVYVQTTAPEIKIGTATDSPNTWLSLAGSGTINFSVEDEFPIVAYLRKYGTTYTLTSELVIQSNPGATFNVQYIVWPPALNPVPYTGSGFTTNKNVWLFNAAGAIVNVISGNAKYNYNDVVSDTALNQGGTFTIPGNGSFRIFGSPISSVITITLTTPG